MRAHADGEDKEKIGSVMAFDIDEWGQKHNDLVGNEEQTEKKSKAKQKIKKEGNQQGMYI